jgi:hypothetical protein
MVTVLTVGISMSEYYSYSYEEKLLRYLTENSAILKRMVNMVNALCILIWYKTMKPFTIALGGVGRGLGKVVGANQYSL